MGKRQAKREKRRDAIRHLSRISNALSSYARLCMYTIDAFCSSLAYMHPPPCQLTNERLIGKPERYLNRAKVMRLRKINLQLGIEPIQTNLPLQHSSKALKSSHSQSNQRSSPRTCLLRTFHVKDLFSYSSALRFLAIYLAKGIHTLIKYKVSLFAFSFTITASYVFRHMYKIMQHQATTYSNHHLPSSLFPPPPFQSAHQHHQRHPTCQ